MGDVGSLKAIRLLWTRESLHRNDIEMQTAHGIQSVDDDDQNRIEALACLFGLQKTQLLKWPGTIAYGRYLEKCFLPLLYDDYTAVWTGLAIDRPQSVKDCWSLFQTIATGIRLLDDREGSIEELWNELVSPDAEPSSTSYHVQQAPPAACYIALFAMLCWGTMTLQPRLIQTHDHGFPSLALQGEQRGLRMDFVQRPIPAIFRSLQRTMSTGRWRHIIGRDIDGKPRTLYVPSLEFASLHIIGKIRLVWVDDLSNHLEFDAASRQLSVFRFPSFCALAALAGNKMPSILTECLHALYDSDGDGDANTEQSPRVHQEVLMSYRLLFAHSKKSRTLLKRSLKELRTRDNCYDSFLDIVSASTRDRNVQGLPLLLWPVTCRGPDGVLLEQSSYSSQDDFPLFGQRLAKLQDFSLRQQPSQLRDLWRDRRNPLQWYTFWAVLVVGGSSIVLAVLQLVVGVLQVVYSTGSNGAYGCVAGCKDI